MSATKDGPAAKAGPAGTGVYLFGAGMSDGRGEMRNLLGGKGANLAEMANLGLPVPPGFTITTDVCAAYFANGRKLPHGLKGDVETALHRLGKAAGARFGDRQDPLLLSVRSGARVSMPGMMDTILNLGLNDETVTGLAARSGDERFAYDSYRRFIQMYGDVVMGVDHGVFEDILENHKILGGLSLDTDLGPDDWRSVVGDYKAAIAAELGRAFPQDIHEQLWGAIAAVFGSWRTPRADTYRRIHNIPESLGTAVNVQAMVFGNMGGNSATGVAFTRNPATGERALYGEFLVNAQGEDVVAGIRTPQSLTEAARIEAGDDKPSLESLMPKVFKDLTDIFARLETHYRDMQDIEFTIQDGKLWMLQTRSGKRTASAALKIATDMVSEGLIGKEDAVLRIDPESLDQLLHPSIDPGAERKIIVTGLPASPGAASGGIVFNSDDAEQAKRDGKDVILVRVETSPADVHGMHAAAGILTARGGMTSHAAVVARGMGRPCVSGAGAARIDYGAGTMSVMGKAFKKGDIITIDGGTGQVLEGRIKMAQPKLSVDFATIMSWADEARALEVRANADTPRDAEQALYFGAQGIGLCRTEHMFFDDARLLAMQQMICAPDKAERSAALARIEPMQRADFEELFKRMAGLPVTIRLLDPPLHEFLPVREKDVAAVAEGLGVSLKFLASRIAELHETNPMLGFRGCRLAIRYPEITQMQSRAIFEAATSAAKETGEPVVPEIMVPLVAYAKEFEIVRDVIIETAKAVASETGTEIDYQIGTMIELPRACLRADEIAQTASFFSFGTNDLTQTCLGLSRDDSAPILSAYDENGIFEADPFASMDQDGVGELVRIGIERGRRTRPDIKLGICGEHAGDPATIAFCHEAGLDYVSTSPYRVPIARLAAAQAAIRGSSDGGSTD